ERQVLQSRGDVGDRIGWLEHQLAELEREDLDPAALEALDEVHRRQANAAGLIAACEEAVARIDGDEGPSLTGLLQQARSRLARIHALARQHRLPATELAAHRDAIAADLETLRGAGDRLLQLDAEIARASECWTEAVAALTATRRVAGEALASATTALIDELGMGGDRFLVELEPAAGAGSRPDPNGAERVEFLVAANAGQPPRPLRKVASGGELSRISLAIEVAALGSDAVPTMVFDEDESGIGGAAAEVVGPNPRC